MAVSELARKIRRFYKLNQERKALEKEENALKEWFKLESAGVEARFADDAHGLEVLVAIQERKLLDQEKLRVEKPKIIEAYTKTSRCQVVTVREMADEKEAA